MKIKYKVFMGEGNASNWTGERFKVTPEEQVCNFLNKTKVKVLYITESGLGSNNWFTVFYKGGRSE